jgi:hypothetical protein
MVTKLYPKGKEALLGATNMSSDNIKLTLLNTGTYTYSDAHDFYDDLSGTLGDSANLSGKSITNGIFDASDTTVTSTGTATCGAFAVWADSGVPGTSPLILYFDGIQHLTIAASSTTSTTITTDPLTYAVANSATLTRVSGSGPASVTLSGGGGGSAGARTLTASSAQSMVQGDVYSVAISGSGIPININSGQTVNITFDSGTNKIFAL